MFPVEVSARGVATLGGETLLLSVVRDVTARKRTERELAHTTARLERTLQAGVAALGTTAELRDPYTAGHQRRVAAARLRARRRARLGARSGSPCCASPRCSTTSARSSCRPRS